MKSRRPTHCKWEHPLVAPYISISSIGATRCLMCGYHRNAYKTNARRADFIPTYHRGSVVDPIPTAARKIAHVPLHRPVVTANDWHTLHGIRGPRGF